MRLTAARVVADAFALFRRDHQALLAVAGAFWFLPAYAVALLVPGAPRPDGTADSPAYAQAVAQWVAAQAPWYLLDLAIGLWGAAAVYRLYSAPEHPDVGAALKGALGLWLRLLLAGAIMAAALLPFAALMRALPGGLGVVPWTLAALYVFGRLLPLGPALAAEQPLAAVRAIGRAWRLTRGSGLALAGAAAALVGLGWLLDQPFALLEAWVRAEGGNPVAVAMIDAGAAAVATAASLGSALLAVAAYRRLAR